MTPREQFIHALERRPPIAGSRVPTFELVHFLTMELFGKVHPSQRAYGQWSQMKEAERELHRADIADLYVRTAERYDWGALLLMSQPWTTDEHLHLVGKVRDQSGDRFFLSVHGDATFSIPGGKRLAEFAYRLADDAQGVKDEAQRNVDNALKDAVRYQAQGELDGFTLCADYCFNTGPFLSPEQMSEFVFPYLKQLIAGYRELGFYVIKHTDGNIMPIIADLVGCQPHALHSLDPQGGVDIAEVKRRYGGQLCLIGNVNCGLMDTGSVKDVEASARYALEHGMPGGGYIFSTSNCVYTGMDLSRYERIHQIWREEGCYPSH